jgi:hypothetical protein
MSRLPLLAMEGSTISGSSKGSCSGVVVPDTVAFPRIEIDPSTPGFELPKTFEFCFREMFPLDPVEPCARA